MHSRRRPHKYAKEGRFLPIGVWEKQGYDIAKIEEHATEADKQWNSKWQWYEYRVPVETDEHTKEDSVTDSVTFRSKAKTRALKKRRTNESEASIPASPAPEEAPSSESSGDDSDDRGARRNKAKVKAKAKGKSKAKAKAQQAKLTAEQKEAKAKAKQQKNKVESSLKAFRETTKHHMILDVPQPITAAAQQNVRMLSELQKRLETTFTSGFDDGCVQAALDLDWPALKKADRALRDALKQHDKAQEKGKKKME